MKSCAAFLATFTLTAAIGSVADPSEPLDRRSSSASTAKGGAATGLAGAWEFEGECTILVAELVDNDGWILLVELARAGGHDQLAQRFERALAEEIEHLAKVRSWVMNANLGAEKPLEV